MSSQRGHGRNRHGHLAILDELIDMVETSQGSQGCTAMDSSTCRTHGRVLTRSQQSHGRNHRGQYPARRRLRRQPRTTTTEPRLSWPWTEQRGEPRGERFGVTTEPRLSWPWAGWFGLPIAFAAQSRRNHGCHGRGQAQAPKRACDVTCVTTEPRPSWPWTARATGCCRESTWCHNGTTAAMAVDSPADVHLFHSRADVYAVLVGGFWVFPAFCLGSFGWWCAHSRFLTIASCQE